MNTSTFASSFGTSMPNWAHVGGLAFFIFILALWTIFWKGLALWHAGRRGSVKWFVALFLINTASILELIYLFGVLKLKFSDLFSK